MKWFAFSSFSFLYSFFLSNNWYPLILFFLTFFWSGFFSFFSHCNGPTHSLIHQTMNLYKNTVFTCLSLKQWLNLMSWGLSKCNCRRLQNLGTTTYCITASHTNVVTVMCYFIARHWSLLQHRLAPNDLTDPEIGSICIQDILASSLYCGRKWGHVIHHDICQKLRETVGKCLKDQSEFQRWNNCMQSHWTDVSGLCTISKANWRGNIRMSWKYFG